MVTWTVAPAGTLKSVVCSHFLVLGSWMKYDTQSGWVDTVFWASSCRTMLTWLPDPAAVITAGSVRKKWMTTKIAPPTTARNATSRVPTRTGRDISHHLVSSWRVARTTRFGASECAVAPEAIDCTDSAARRKRSQYLAPRMTKLSSSASSRPLPGTGCGADAAQSPQEA